MRHLYGTKNEDRIIGTDADEALYGFDKADTLIGGGGDDALFGGNGNDFLCGSTWPANGRKDEVDRLTGGRGRDTFVAAGYIGKGDKDYVEIMDFDPREDRILLDRGLVYSVTAERGVAEIRYGRDLVARVHGLEASTLLGTGCLNPAWVSWVFLAH